MLKCGTREKGSLEEAFGESDKEEDNEDEEWNEADVVQGPIN